MNHDLVSNNVMPLAICSHLQNPCGSLRLLSIMLAKDVSYLVPCHKDEASNQEITGDHQVELSILQSCMRSCNFVA